MSDYPTHAKYRITASKMPGEPVATLRQAGTDKEITWESYETGHDEQIWYFEPLEGYEYTYYIRNAKHPDSYMEFHGAPENNKGLVSQSAAFHSWRVDRLCQNAFTLKVADQDTSYWIGNGVVDGQLALDWSGYLNLYFELVQ